MALNNETYAPEHMLGERTRFRQWATASVLIAVLAVIASFAVAPLVYFCATQPFSNEIVKVIADYFSQLSDPSFALKAHNDVWQTSIMAGIFCAGGSLIAGMFIGGIVFISSPFLNVEATHGLIKWATDRDIERMEKRGQIGINGGYVGVLGKWKNGRYLRLIEPISVSCPAPPGSGKCLHPEEPVLMYDGTIRKTKDLKVGDLLMGPDSTPRKILATNPGWGPLYRVTPVKGRSFVCNGDHILSLRCSKRPRRRAKNPLRGTIRFTTVHEWLTWGSTQRGLWKQWRTGVDFPNGAAPDELPLDPYLVGLFIGDGATRTKVTIHSADPEIKDTIYAAAARHGMKIREERQENNASTAYHFSAGNMPGVLPKGKNPFLNKLAELGLRCGAGEKQIPHIYKTASRYARLEVLAGLIDTDGSVAQAGNSIDFISKSETLSNDVAFVARSLGLAAYVKSCVKRDTKTGFTGTYYRVSISGHIDQIPTRVARKRASPRRQIKDVTNTGFNIEPIGDGPWFGIIIDGDHQYLLDDFTVTHNTASLVVPAIVESPTISMIVNDPKPELADMTSGYRAELGYVFILDWSATDKPDKNLFYPRFNFLSSDLVPPAGTAERDTYIDAIAQVLIPKGKSGDSYFIDKGRDALTGFIHYLVSHVNDRKSTEGIPTRWHGYEASFPMLVEWLAEAQYAAEKEAQRQNDNAAENRQVPNADGMKIFFSNLCDTAREREYSPRAFTSLSNLINMADKERSGVLGTMDQALIPFKNRAVMERTAASDFSSKDLRGIWSEVEQRWLPVTLYICVNQAEASAFANITALLYEVLSRDLLSYGPNETNKRGEELGPLTVCFMLDEFAKLPKCDTVAMGPDLGRSKKTCYWFFYQARAQLINVYGREIADAMDSTIGAHVVLPQNDPNTADHYIKMVGKTTNTKKSYSKNAGFGKSVNPFTRNESIASEGVDFLRKEDITAMKPGTHLVLAQNFHNRPIKVQSPFFFQDPGMIAKVYNLRTGKGPKPARPMPSAMTRKRHEEWETAMKRKEQQEAAAQGAIIDTLATPAGA